MQLFMCMTHDTEIPLMSHTDKHTHISLIISEGSPYPWTLFSVLWVPQGNSWSSPVTPSMDDDEAVGGSRAAHFRGLCMEPGAGLQHESL